MKTLRSQKALQIVQLATLILLCDSGGKTFTCGAITDTEEFWTGCLNRLTLSKNFVSQAVGLNFSFPLYPLKPLRGLKDGFGLKQKLD